MKTFSTLFPSKVAAMCAVAFLFLMASCSKNRDTDTTDPFFVAPNVNIYVLSQDNKISSFNAQSGYPVNPTVTITGMATGENMLAIDVRPATGQLYGVSSGSKVYMINVLNGLATPVSNTPFSPAISGTAIGIDFNPTVDRLRLVSNTGQNLRINPETAVAVTDGPVNGVTGAKISSVAYTENFAGATTTILYDIDAVTKKLYKQDPPNDGKLVEVGGLGVEATEVSDFDIAPDSKAALAAITVGGQQGLYALDLTTGKAYKTATFNSKTLSVAIFTNPVAYAINTNNELLIFNPVMPQPVAKTITGLQAGELILGIDFRPANGQLYALGSTSRLYTINVSSGAAAVVGAAFTPALDGASFGFDFNPMADRIRVVSNTGQNLRINPADGVATADVALTPAGAGVNAAAYSNNVPGATSTVLYNISSLTGKLYKQDAPNTGVLTERGSLGVTIDAANGFDISAVSGLGYAMVSVGGATRFCGINLDNGSVSNGTAFPQAVRAFALGLGF
jgi:hypothetical protein